MNIKKLSPEKFAEIRKSRSFKRAMQALEAYVSLPQGRKPLGARAMTGAEKVARHRAAKRQREESGNQAGR
jgi:hypothetical protein